jgi:hypothetical protein
LGELVLDTVLRLNDHEFGASWDATLDICSAARLAVAQESLPDALQQRLQQALGSKGVVELVLCGFYRCIANVVTAFDVALPNAGPPPF